MRLAILDNVGDQRAEIASSLREAGHSCAEFVSVAALRRSLARQRFDLLLIGDDPADGSADLLIWAKTRLPAPPHVMLLAGNDASGDSVSCADELLARDTPVEQLSARVAALTEANTEVARPVVERFGDYAFNASTQVVTTRGNRIELTAKEFGLALLLFRNQGRPLSRAEIMDAVWARDPIIGSRTLDAHISQIRGRLGLRAENGWQLAAVYGFGYRLDRLRAALRRR